MANKRRNSLNSTLEKIQEIKELTLSPENELNIAELSQYGIAGSKGDSAIDPNKIEQALGFISKDSPLLVQQENQNKGSAQVVAEVLEDVQLEYQQTPLLPIDVIRPNKHHARKIHNAQEFDKLKQSIKVNGVLQPIVVRPIPREDNFLNYSYEIVAGYRRWKACYELGLDTIPAIINDVDSDLVPIVGMVENLVRENTHPIEETYAILQLLKDLTGKDEQEIVSSLGRLHREEAGQVKGCMAMNSEGGRLIMKIFEILPITLGTFVTHRLKILSMNEDILDAIIQNKIGISVGVLIDSYIPDDQIKVDLLNEVITYNYSRQKVKERIDEIRHEFYNEGSKQVKYTLVQVAKKLVSKRIWDESDRRYLNKLEKLVQEMNELIEAYETKRSPQKLSD